LFGHDRDETDNPEDDSMRTNGNKTALQLRWLRLKRHLRSTSTSARALRDAARAMSGELLPVRTRRRLCGRPARLAA
jgi:hypothetical protein